MSEGRFNRIRISNSWYNSTDKRKNSGHNRGAVEVITTIDLLKMLLLEVMFMMKRKETPSEDTPIG